MTHLLKGIAVSSGIGRGTAYVIAYADGVVAPRREIAAAEVESELGRFATALARAERDLLALKKAVGEKIGPNEAEIFGVHQLLLGDAAFQGPVIELVRDKHLNVESAVADVIEKFTRKFDEIPDAYLRERAADIRDVGRRVLSLLAEEHASESLEIPPGAIVVADELLPSITARLELGAVRGFVIARGGKFSHTSILARAQGIPAVIGLRDMQQNIKTGDHLLVDGFAGVVFVNPRRILEREYERLELEIQTGRQKLRELVDLPAVTLDGTRIELLANVSKFADTEAALLHNADGIGLYRTEFSFAIRSAPPTEDEQYDMLRRAAARFAPRRVVLRLLDVGGDKELPYLAVPASRNPSLGRRGIRLLLQHPDVLKRQLRAFLRVSAEHPISILIPVVGGLEEIRETRQLLREVEGELRAEGRAFDPHVPLGAMLEVPSAALLARTLAREVDFFTLGTNDLVQYLLAADREDLNSAQYYQPLHPAVLGLIRSVAEAARDTARPLSICGDMAADPLFTELLLGLGLREFSVTPGAMLDVKNRIRSTTVEKARELAERAVALGSAGEVEALLKKNQTPA